MTRDAYNFNKKYNEKSALFLRNPILSHYRIYYTKNDDQKQQIFHYNILTFFCIYK